MQDERADPYALAGVSIDRGDALVRAIAPLARATARAGGMPALGGFGAFFDPKAAGFSDPLLVATTDGVGTKLKLAIETGMHDTVGIDLVAMCVNDLIVQGAEPLFFLDYFACGRLDVDVAARVVKGIAQGCGEAGCALVGGETAEMPGMYAPGDYDLAGFSVGAVERGAQITGEGIAPGDVILGLASSGVHSNGFSLVRKLVAEAGLNWGEAAPWAEGETVAGALLAPTRIYVKALLPAAKAGLLKGLAHITGGGLVENPPRVLPEGCRAVIDASAWTLPPVFEWLRGAGGLAPAALARTFNCGVGMIAVVRAADADSVAARLAAAGETVWRIGQVEAGENGCVVHGTAGIWGQDADWVTA